jgi:hypothetical protein
LALTPGLQRELTVCHGKGTDKVILEGLNGTFGGIDTVVVGCYENKITLLLYEEFLYLSACLIGHEVEFYFLSFALEKLEFSSMCFKKCAVFHVRNRQG